MSHHATCRKKAMGCGGCQKCWMFFVNYRHDIISFRGTWQFFENCMMAQPVVQVKGRNAENRTYVGDNAGGEWTESSLGAQTLCCFPNWEVHQQQRRRTKMQQKPKNQPQHLEQQPTPARTKSAMDARSRREAAIQRKRQNAKRQEMTRKLQGEEQSAAEQVFMQLHFEIKSSHVRDLRLPWFPSPSPL